MALDTLFELFSVPNVNLLFRFKGPIAMGAFDASVSLILIFEPPEPEEILLTKVPLRLVVVGAKLSDMVAE